jgi:hypothetical protein
MIRQLKREQKTDLRLQQIEVLKSDKPYFFVSIFNTFVSTNPNSYYRLKTY